MITTTLEAIYKAAIEADSSHVIYIIRESDQVLYVGQSKSDVVKRIRSHSYDALRRYIDEHWPQVLGCQVEFCTIEDCQNLLNWQNDQTTVDDYEFLLIRYLEPRLNVVGNSLNYFPSEAEKSLKKRPEFAQDLYQAMPQLMKEVIYLLEDPRDHTIRFVGNTARSVAKRLTEFIKANTMQNRDLYAWIAELRDLDLIPILHEFDIAPSRMAATERVQLLIRWYLEQGEPLLNSPPKRPDKPPLILPELSEQKLLQIAAQTGKRPHDIIERLLDAEINRIRTKGDKSSAIERQGDT